MTNFFFVWFSVERGRGQERKRWGFEDRDEVARQKSLRPEGLSYRVRYGVSYEMSYSVWGFGGLPGTGDR